MKSDSSPATEHEALPREEFMRLSVDDTLDVLDRYPNLCAVLRGTVSGDHTEWPMLRTELQILCYSIHVHTEEIRAQRSETATPDWQRRYEDEYAIVDRCWKALGISRYEDAKGKAIDEIISELVARSATVTREEG